MPSATVVTSGKVCAPKPGFPSGEADTIVCSTVVNPWRNKLFDDKSRDAKAPQAFSPISTVLLTGAAKIVKQLQLNHRSRSLPG